MIEGITPVHSGTTCGVGSAAIGVTAIGATALPTLAGPGPQRNVDDETTTTVIRYPRKMIVTAAGGGLMVNFGTAGVGAPTVTAGMFFPSSGAIVINRKKGWTHYDAISADGSSTGLKLHITVLEWDKEGVD
jgi:hypothetical protein